MTGLSSYPSFRLAITQRFRMIFHSLMFRFPWKKKTFFTPEFFWILKRAIAGKKVTFFSSFSFSVMKSRRYKCHFQNNTSLWFILIKTGIMLLDLYLRPDAADSVIYLLFVSGDRKRMRSFNKICFFKQKPKIFFCNSRRIQIMINSVELKDFQHLRTTI